MIKRSIGLLLLALLFAGILTVISLQVGFATAALIAGISVALTLLVVVAVWLIIF